MTIFKLIPFWIFILLYQFGGNIYFTYLPILGDRLTTTWIAGLIVGGLSLIQCALDVPAGILLDRFGYTKMLKLGTIIFICSCFILAFVPGFLGFILTAISGGIGWLFMAPGVNAYVLSTAPKIQAEKFISYRDSFTAIGICLGSIVVTYTFGLPPLIVGLISAAVLIFALIFIWLTPKDTISVHQEIKVKRHHFYIRRNIFRKLFKAINKLNPASWMLLLQGFCASLFYGAIWFIVPIMIADPSQKIFGFSLGIFDLAILLTGLIFGKFFSKAKENKIILIGLLLFSFGGLIIGHQIEWLFILFGFFASVGDEMSNIALWSWLTKLDQNHETDGEVSSVISFFIDIGFGIGPIVSGILLGIFGGGLTVTLCAIPILITFLISSFLISKNHHTFA
jgi:MFS family permease